MNGKRITVITSARFACSVERVWQGITNASMTYPKPLCFNLGIPLPVKCEITDYRDGIGRRRRCTSDHGSIEQEITCYEKFRRLSFRLVSHNLKTTFAIGPMDDDFTLQDDGGVIGLTRTTNLVVPYGFCLSVRCWAIRRSLANVHRYVYRNIAAG